MSASQGVKIQEKIFVLCCYILNILSLKKTVFLEHNNTTQIFFLDFYPLWFAFPRIVISITQVKNTPIMQQQGRIQRGADPAPAPSFGGEFTILHEVFTVKRSYIWCQNTPKGMLNYGKKIRLRGFITHILELKNFRPPLLKISVSGAEQHIIR